MKEYQKTFLYAAQSALDNATGGWTAIEKVDFFGAVHAWSLKSLKDRPGAITKQPRRTFFVAVLIAMENAMADWAPNERAEFRVQMRDWSERRFNYQISVIKMQEHTTKTIDNGKQANGRHDDGGGDVRF